ncbi:MAG: hypothetical protein ACI4KJ_06565 [Anaerovoracaceae bacterium]
MRRRMVVVIAALVSAMLVLSACGGSSPSKAVSDQLDKIKSAEMGEALASVVDSAELSDDNRKLYESFVKNLHDFDYEITDEEISSDGDKATVSVKITTYDFGKAYLDAYEEIITDMGSGSFNADKMYENLFGSLSGVEEKNFEETVNVTCRKNDSGDWESDVTTNSVLVNAIFGGLQSVVEDMEEM